MVEQKDKISFTVTAVKDFKSRKKGETSFKSQLILNSENQEKATIVCPESGSWNHVKPGDIIELRVAHKQRSLSDIEAEEKEKAAERKKMVEEKKALAAASAKEGKKAASA